MLLTVQIAFQRSLDQSSSDRLIALLSLFCYLFYICVFHGSGILVTSTSVFPLPSPLPYTPVMYQHSSSKGFRKALLYDPFTDAELRSNPPPVVDYAVFVLISRAVSI